MATLQKDALFIGKDSAGNTVLMYPITTADNVDGLEEALAEKAEKATYVSTTLAAATWNKTAKTYSFEATYPFASYDISIQPDKSCTAAQLEAYMSMIPLGSADSNVITAGGEVPAVSIPVILKVVKK